MFDKIKSKKNEILLFALVVLGLLLLIKPELVNSEISFKNIEDKKSALENVNMEIRSTEASTESIVKNIPELRKEKKDKELEAMEREKEINMDDLKYHLPSILIRLERNAKKNNLSLFIDQQNIKTYSYGDSISRDIEDVEDKIEEAIDDIGDAVKEEIDKDEEENEEIEEEREEEYASRMPIDVPQVEGLKTTMINTEIEGNYKQVREFIRLLDEINYIEPAVIKLVNIDNKIKAIINIAVFHND